MKVTTIIVMFQDYFNFCISNYYKLSNKSQNKLSSKDKWTRHQTR